MKSILTLVLNKIDDFRLNKLSKSFINLISRQNYAHNLEWCGVQIFQTPTDLFLYQQLIFRARPNVIIETGVAKGGSVLFACQILDNMYGKSDNIKWRIICCDINSLENAKKVVSENGFAANVIFHNGDSSDISFRNLVSGVLETEKNPAVLLSLDSDHTEEHVYNELSSLAPFVTLDSYAIVWDSRISDLSRISHYLRPRRWSKKHNAGTGVNKFMKFQARKLGFKTDLTFETNLKITGVKSGILRRVSRAESNEIS